MGTRSVIKFYETYEDVKESTVFLCAVYQQYDGYLNGVGKELKNFLTSRPFVNGISDYNACFNGAGCCIAQFIKEFKERAGGLYIYPEKSEQEFTYEVTFINTGEGFDSRITKVKITCNESEEEEIEEYDDYYKELKNYNEVLLV